MLQRQLLNERAKGGVISPTAVQETAAKPGEDQLRASQVWREMCTQVETAVVDTQTSTDAPAKFGVRLEHDELSTAQVDKQGFTVVFLGDGCNGQSSLLAVLTGSEMCCSGSNLKNEAINLEPTSEEVKVRFNNASYEITMIDAGDRIVACGEECFGAADVLVLVVDLAVRTARTDEMG